MNISHEKLLAKIEQQVGQAKQAPSSQMREHLHAIRTLCDLALDEPSGGISAQRIEPVQPSSVYQAPVQQPVSMQKDKPIRMEDGSNGDSLFDF
ncbi:hypothetical protein E2R51_10125 [Jeotgalibacillus sp. S-D1]|uniref:YwdI family protein n=1 Tax=Jeotgalibacillus sp. S-D1 TaxID=2552189 RepID=UPI00105A79D2|nr:YwdI family protein [Jeotgalibacillus sp. S-D1]TDL33008.1 hypothetical protein E2R51_10125 [Jeotgalibacillus sp. S-D1]